MPNLTAVNLAANAGPAAARNRAVQESSGPLLLFLDDDVVASPSLLARHLHHHAGGDATRAVLGRIEWHGDLTITPFMRWLDRSGLQFAFDTWLREGPVVPPYAAFYTANLSLHRELFETSGGFDERFPYAAYEDMELAWRLTSAGLALEFRPDALAFHRRGITLPDFRRRMKKVGESAALLAHVQPDFPVDDDLALAGRRGWRGRAALSLLARVAPTDKWRHAHYGAEVAAAYLEGRTRAATDRRWAWTA
jgi:glycosyltransferase involved in cell wall biosynthesis